MQNRTITGPAVRLGTPDIGRGWFIALGIVLVVIGAASVLFPFLAAWSLEFAVGAALIAGGVLTLIHAVRVRGWRGTALQGLLALLYIGGGIIFLTNPFAGLLALTVMFGAFFAADGVARVLLAFRIRPQRAWWLFLVSGLLALLLGILVLLGLPSGWSVAFLGIFVGINLIFTGVSFACCTGGDDRSSDAISD
jgi:uncharacterized membrane protein HdeD (DUF308 family)